MSLRAQIPAKGIELLMPDRVEDDIKLLGVQMFGEEATESLDGVLVG